MESEAGGGPWDEQDEVDFESATGDVAVWSTVSLTEAPWYPSRPGDRLMVTLGATEHPRA
ncbi:hypothetical protein ACFU98_43775 [Streptomyces sp. NPDC057575]|uniref:hypothetical protein n=1 Tax=unclassified Streptomyces TaxID=2593676 RepID=UPI0036CCC37F